MTSPAAREPLVGVTSVCLVQTFPHQRPAGESHGCINEEHATQYEPHPDSYGVIPRRSHGEHGDHVTKVSATDISHEDFRRRPVPDQEACGSCAKDAGNGHHVGGGGV